MGALAVLAIAALALPAANAAAQETVVAENSQAYVDPQVTIDQGDSLFFENRDPFAQHDVTSTAGLFRSRTIPAGQTVPVERVESLDPGRYPFLCSVHPQMRGTLTVSGAILGLQVRPRRARVTAPGARRYRATVRNRGDAVTPNPVRVCANAPRGVNVRGQRCRAVGTLAVGATAQVRFRVRATRRASTGRNRLRFAARSPGSRNAQARAILRVR